MIPNPNGFVPPQPGTPIVYICQSCGERFSVKKTRLPKPVQCPKCGSAQCVSPVVF